jgi:hypothetical protein
MSLEGQAAQPPTSGQPQEERCPWCSYRGTRKRVLTHMEYEHHARWEDLALYPPIAGGVF